MKLYVFNIRKQNKNHLKTVVVSSQSDVNFIPSMSPTSMRWQRQKILKLEEIGSLKTKSAINRAWEVRPVYHNVVYRLNWPGYVSFIFIFIA